jgi:hypothetical protein
VPQMRLSDTAQEHTDVAAGDEVCTEVAEL